MNKPKPRKSPSGTRWTDADRLERSGVVRVTVPIPVALRDRIGAIGAVATVIRATLEQAFPGSKKKSD